LSTLPTGTLTFLFSDIEGSTRLLEALGEDYGSTLERHHEIFRAVFEEQRAIEVANEGDSFFAVCERAVDAVEVAVRVQRALAQERWPHESRVLVRMGLHTGEASLAGGTYVGLDIHRAARIMAAAHGGQILASDATRALVERDVERIAFRDLGQHRLRDLAERERLFQVVADGLGSEFPPLRTLDGTRNDLPIPPSELIGRDFELLTISERLASPAVRLLTLLGPGGIGKTRLALQVANDEGTHFEDGIYFVDLAGARTRDAVLQAITAAVLIEPTRDSDLRSALVAQLEGRHLLLLLDNFEQVVEAADDIALLLERCPRLKLLVTSREALRIRSEHLFPVEPLALPAAQAVTADEIARAGAVLLFVDRAQRARPDFVLTDENAPAVAEICLRLDGLPLALELAAARLRLLSPAELLERLRNRFEVLSGGARDLPARHRTLRGTIAWSYELLDDDERRVFELLSLFPSARLEAVELVAARLAPLADVDVVERLASLVDKSLIRFVEGDAGQRLTMLGTIREYASEQLLSEPEFEHDARRQHAEFYAALATAERGELVRLGDEIGNLEAAWSFFLELGDAARLSALLDSLWPLFDARGWYYATIARTNELLDVLARTAPAPGRAEEEIMLRLGVARGLLALRGYTEEVERIYRDALAIAERSGTSLTELPVLKSLASFHLYRGEIDATAEIGRKALELAEQSGDAELQVEADLMLGPVLAFSGDYRTGLEHLDRAIALFDPERHGRRPFRLGPNPGVAARVVSGVLNWIVGRPDTGVERARDGLALAERLAHPYSRAYAGMHVGLLALWSKRPELAAQEARHVLTIADEHEYRVWRAVALVLEGVSTAYLGRPQDGLEVAELGVSLYENLRTPPIFWPQLLGLRADAYALAGREAEALPLLDRSLELVPAGSWEFAARSLQRAQVLGALDDRDAYEAALRAARDNAASAGTRMTELEAATALAKLSATSGGRDVERLHALVGSFTEGFETAQMLEARAVLDRAYGRV
jgi:predicted ATPase/class 3 adenylate cyclase